MALRFRLKGLAETIVESISCPCCGLHAHDDEKFSADFTRVTFDGIVIVLECADCSEIFVPDMQHRGISDQTLLIEAVEKDAQENGIPLLPDASAVQLDVERLNAARRGEIH